MTNKNYIFIGFILALLCAPRSWTQARIDGHTFIQRGLGEFANETDSDPEDISMPRIEEYEFRTESQDFDLDRQEYTFRVSPSTPQKRKAQQAKYNHIAGRPDFVSDEYRCRQLADLHADWLSMYIIHRRLNLLARIGEVLADRQKILRKQVEIFKMDAREFVKLATNLTDAALAQKEMDLEWEALREKYAYTSEVLDFEDMIDAEKIVEIVSAQSFNGEQFFDREDAFDKSALLHEYALEKAEKQQYLDFAQIRYRGPHSDLLEERISLGLAFRLPNSGNRKIKMQELLFEMESIDREQIMRSERFLNRIEDLKRRILKDIKRLDYYTTVVADERVKLLELGQIILREEGVSPSLSLDVEERHIQTQLEILDMEEDIMDNFLEYLVLTNQMCSEVPINHLVDRQ